MKRLICRHCGESLNIHKLGSYFEYTHAGDNGWCYCAPHWRHNKGVRRDDLGNSFALPLTDNDLIDKLLEKYKSTVGPEPIESKNLGEFRV